MKPPSNVLVCGANGFIGSRIAASLLQAGHGVTCGSATRLRADLPHVPVDFSHDTDPATWLPRLKGFDTVVNAVGVLRDSARRPMKAVHTTVPAALFAACAQAGVRRIVQISALGIGRDDADNPTLYARTKRAAEAALQALPPDGPSWIALRPSVVLGKGGDATQLFRTLAALPVLAMPGPALDARLQPVHVEDLARAVAVLADPASPSRGVVEFGGAREMTLAEVIATLRAARGGTAPRPARVVRLPAWIGVLSSRAGDFVPGVPWSTDTRLMLEHDNVASNAPLHGWLGAAPRDLRDFASAL
ncbi:MAG: NAD-dependent epimerase/dehydratase family protein [Variovorax sp.]|nr:MAG: NAD-dependent epimerase/dehydratase family protein [Variovorax sp.]